MPKSTIEQNERLARLEVFNEKVVEPSLVQILSKLDGLVSLNQFNERNEYVDQKISNLEESIKAINKRNEVLDGNIFIKAIRPAENKLVAFIIQVTGLVLLIGPTLFIIYSQSIQKKPEVIKERVNGKERIEK